MENQPKEGRTRNRRSQRYCAVRYGDNRAPA